MQDADEQMSLFEPTADRGRLYAAFRAARLAHRMSFEQACASPAVLRALVLDARNRQPRRSDA